MPGVEIHANALETYLTGARLRAVPPAISAALAAGAALLRRRWSCGSTR